MNSDGSLDSTFDPGTGATIPPTGAGDTVGPVFAVALQSDGKIVIGGVFTKYNGTPRNDLARLNANGSLDTTFDPGVGPAEGFFTVEVTAVQPDGKILVGGDFPSFDNTPRNAIVRLNANGTLDATFNAGAVVRPSFAQTSVDTISLQADGRMIVVGAFDTLNGTARLNIARLNANGSVDSSFNPPEDAGGGNGGSFPIAATTLQTDGKVIVGGGRHELARLLPATGKISYSSGSYSVGEANGSATITVTRTGGTDGQVLAKVTPTDVTTSPADYIFKPGAVDTTFKPGGGNVATAVVQADGKIVIGGSVFNYNGGYLYGLVRLNPDGLPDPSFNPGSGTFTPNTNSVVFAIAFQPDGRMLIGGVFANYNGVTRHSVARVNPDGSLDFSFDPGAGLDAQNQMRAIAVQPDGRILLGGDFVSYNGIARSFIARANADGSSDPTFEPEVAGFGTGLNGTVQAIALQPDGRIIVGGEFQSYQGIPRNFIARLDRNGALDPSFNPGMGANTPVDALALQADGKMIIAGSFTTYNGIPRPHIARLNADGSLDAGFNPGASPDGSVKAIAIEPDGKLIIAGTWSSYNGATNSSVARLNSNGSFDAAFDPGDGPNTGVNTIALQPGGNIIAGGGFIRFNNIPSRGLVRLTNGDFFVTWPTGDGSNKILELPIVDDSLHEANETLTLGLVPLIGGATLGLHPNATLTIVDNEMITFANWQQGFFSPQELNNPAISGDSADPDGDGLSNLLEYAFHLDPKQPSAANRPYSSMDANYFSLIYTKAIAATDLTCTVEESADLITWSAVIPVNVILADDGVTQTVKAQVPIMGGREMSLRLRVSR